MLMVCAATEGELAAMPESMAGVARVVSGVGIPATFAHLVRPAPLPDLLLNIGIAGAYPDTNIAIGDIVLADGETYGDVGFELPDGYRSIADSPWGHFYLPPQRTVCPQVWIAPPSADLPYRVHSARGCTVNTCTGTLTTGVRRSAQAGAGFETMEGAAVAQIAQGWGVPLCEIRAISNIAAQRDMRPENIRLALSHLRHYLETCWGQAAVQ